MMIVDFQADSAFRPSKPEFLFEGPFSERTEGTPLRYGVDPKAQRFLVIVPPDNPSALSTELNVVTHWFES